MSHAVHVLDDLQQKFSAIAVSPQPTRDGIPTLWVPKEQVRDVLRYLKFEAAPPYRVLYDLSVVDERVHANRQGQPPSEFTVVYHLLSYERNAEIRLKVALQGSYPSIRSIVDLWPAANWYEREAWDMFGVTFEGHPNLRRILMPPTWSGHPLRKEHPARATEMGPFQLPDAKQEAEEEALRFNPEAGGMEPRGGGHRIHVSQPRAATPRHARRAAPHPTARR